MKRFLITTALEETWSEDHPVLFLGEWCRLYNRKTAWKDLDAEVVPYHWDDRKKLHQDYLYLQGLYEELLQELAEKLNTLHGVSHSVRYWRILVGEWLGFFIQMLFDRWVMIERAVHQHDIAGVKVLDTSQEQMIPNDMGQFNQLYVSDAWNEAIYGQLLRRFTNMSVETVPPVQREIAETKGNVTGSPRLPLLRRLKSTLVHFASSVSQLLSRDHEAFFLSTYLPIKQNFLLQWRLGQLPKFWSPFPTPKSQVDRDKRRWQIGRPEAKGFSAIVRAMIPQHIPLLYLEGYDTLQERCADLPWPKAPRIIFTSNAFSSDDIFKAWAASRVERSAPLVLGQHGGTYGMTLWNFLEGHQWAISDAWLSWGWKNDNNDKIKPVGNLKLIGQNMDWDPDGYALMVEMTMPRYSYHMYSAPAASQWLDYFEEQSRFVTALPENLRAQLLVRLYSHDYGWCQRERWKDRFPQICLDDGNISINSLIKKSRLYISTYNSTTFLESLAMNIPTIMFWDPKQWELCGSAQPYFDQLKKVGVFHESPESAAGKLAEIWDDVPRWWNQPEIQTTRQHFCNRFSRMSANPLRVLKEALNSVNSKQGIN